MPETMFRVRWPDGAIDDCYSPSSVIMRFVEPGQVYPLDDFVGRCRDALTEASRRVRLRYGGTGCARAMAQLAAIENKAARLADASSSVVVEGFA